MPPLRQLPHAREQSDAFGTSPAVRPVRHGWSSDLGAIKRLLERPRDPSAHRRRSVAQLPASLREKRAEREIRKREVSGGLGDIDHRSSERRPERLP